MPDEGCLVTAIGSKLWRVALHFDKGEKPISFGE